MTIAGDIVRTSVSVIRGRKTLILVVFLLALFVQAAFMAVVGPDPGRSEPRRDYLHIYKPVAENILQGQGINVYDGEVLTRIVPGYPVYLSAVFWIADVLHIDRRAGVTLSNMVSGSLSTVLLFLLGENLFGRRIALIAAALWATYPINLWTSTQPFSMGPFVPLVIASMLLLVRTLSSFSAGSFFLGGILMGLASLVRPIGIFLAPVSSLYGAWTWKKQRMSALLAAGLVMTGSAVAVIPWEIYAYRHTGKLILLSNQPPGAMRDGLTFCVVPGEDGDQVTVSEELMEFMRGVDANKDKFMNASNLAAYCYQHLREKPRVLVELGLLKAARCWYATDEMRHEAKILTVQSVYLVSGLLGVFVCIRQHKERLSPAIYVLLVLAGFWGMTFMVLSIVRYMVPAMAVVILFSAVSLSALPKYVEKWWRAAELRTDSSETGPPPNSRMGEHGWDGHTGSIDRK